MPKMRGFNMCVTVYVTVCDSAIIICLQDATKFATYIVASGLPYGGEEGIFHFLFKVAHYTMLHCLNLLSLSLFHHYISTSSCPYGYFLLIHAVPVAISSYLYFGLFCSLLQCTYFLLPSLPECMARQWRSSQGIRWWSEYSANHTHSWSSKVY